MPNFFFFRLFELSTCRFVVVYDHFSRDRVELVVD